MANDILERRALELFIRRAEAEEQLFERRLDRLADDEWRARRTTNTLHRDVRERRSGE